MTTQQEASAITTITQHYPFEQQREILVEECAELIQAVQKMKRNSSDLTAYNNFIEEIADVSIMIDQMFAYIGTPHISVIREKKLERQIERIKDERTTDEQNRTRTDILPQP